MGSRQAPVFFRLCLCKYLYSICISIIEIFLYYFYSLSPAFIMRFVGRKKDVIFVNLIKHWAGAHNPAFVWLTLDTAAAAGHGKVPEQLLFFSGTNSF